MQLKCGVELNVLLGNEKNQEWLLHFEPEQLGKTMLKAENYLETMGKCVQGSNGNQKFSFGHITWEML